MDTSLFLLILSASLPKKRIIKPIGVTTIKNTIPITMGDIIEPKKIPNLYHSLFNGLKNLEFKTPKTKKTKDKIKNYFSLIQIKQKFPLIQAPDSLIDLC